MQSTPDLTKFIPEIQIRFEFEFEFSCRINFAGPKIGEFKVGPNVR